MTETAKVKRMKAITAHDEADFDAAHGLATGYVSFQATPAEYGEANMMRDMLAISAAYIALYAARRTA